MAYKSDFHTAVKTVRPLMKGTGNMGDFTAGLIDMGLRPDPNSEGKVLALALRANATWKCYANETSQPPSDLASELVGRWDQYRFADNVTNAYEEPAQNGLTDNLNALDASTTKGNVAEGLGSLLFRSSTQATYSNATATPATLSLVDKADRDGAAYIDEKTNRLRLGDRPMAQPPQTTTLDTIQNQELVYVAALLSVYCEEQERSETKSTVDDIPKRLTSHFQNQRKAFHQAEWVREVSWNSIYNGQPLFDEFLQAIYAEVTDTNLRQHSNGLEQLLATLSQSAAVQLDDVRLEQIIDPIDAWSRKGPCHELVARNRMGWDRLIKATFLDISFEAELRAPVRLFLLGDAADGDHLGTLETITVNARTFGVGADNLNGRHRHASGELNTSTVLMKEVLLHPAIQGRVKMEGTTAPARFAITSAGESVVNQMHSSYAQCFFSGTLETIGQTSDSGTNKSAAIIRSVSPEKNA